MSDREQHPCSPAHQERASAKSAVGRRRNAGLGRARLQIRADALKTQLSSMGAVLTAMMRAVLDGLRVEVDRNGRGPCPIHGGKNRTSFSVRGAAFRCFSCGAKGDIFGLVQRLRDCDFKSAVQFCADLTGLDERSVSSTRIRREIKEKRRREEARQAERHRLQQRFEHLISEYWDTEADIKLVEGIWSRDPEILSRLTGSALNDLGDLHLRLNQLEWELDRCRTELGQHWKRSGPSPQAAVREYSGWTVVRGLSI